MRITTWNVNGVRSLKKSIENVLKDLSSEISCFQETKVSRSQLPETTALVEGYTSYFSYPRKQSGYSGVATYCKDEFVPDDAEEGLSVSLSNEDNEYSSLSSMELLADNVCEFDHEGRIIVTYHLIKYEDEIKRLAVINVYCPRVDPEKLDRYLYKMRFCYRLELKARELSEKGCSVIIVGDMNITFSTIDSCDPGDEEEFYSSKPRMWFRNFLNSTMPYNSETTGIIDAFRYFSPDQKEAYTCWHTATSARLNNYGTRIDYILLSSNLLPLLQSCELMTDYHGSDHCPVTSVFKCDSISLNSVKLPSICTRLWPEFSGRQQKLQSFFQKAANVTRDECKEPEPKKVKLSAKKNNQKSIMSFFKTPTAQVKKSEQLAPLPSSDATQGEVEDNSRVVDSCAKSCKMGDGLKNGCSSTQSSAMKSKSTDPLKPPLCCQRKVECVLRTVENEMSITKSSTASSTPCETLNEIPLFVESPEGETNSSQNVVSNAKFLKNNEEVSSSSQSVVWKSMLTGPPKPPLCSGHKVESVLRTVKKKGPNFGKQFFICSFPAGDSNNPNASCNFFQWAFPSKASKKRINANIFKS